MIKWVTQPKHRSKLRRRLGKEYFILRRKVVWLLNGSRYAATFSTMDFPNTVISHKSFLLRPLRNVEMYLQHNKVTNLKLAIEKINNIVLRPGETFSFWYLVGKPSEEKGYKPGLVLNQGKIESGIGGGLCQIGNLIFWMTLHTPLTIKERYRHGYDVFPDINRSIPFGCGATLAYNYIDIQIQNTTSQNFQFKFWLSDENLHGEIRSEQPLDERYEIYESNHEIVHQYWGGYTRHNQIKRKTFNKKTNALISDEPIVENHAIMMYEPLLPQGA